MKTSNEHRILLRDSSALAYADGLLSDAHRTSENSPPSKAIVPDGYSSKEACDSIEKAAMALIQAEKMAAVHRLSSRMVHDFNNLIGVIRNNLERVLDGPIDNDRAKRLLRGAHLGAERTALLIQKLAEISGCQALHPIPVETNPLIVDFATSFDASGFGATKKNAIQVELNLYPALPRILLDPGQFRTNMARLATNACEAMPRGGRLLIKTGVDVIDAPRASTTANIAAGTYVFVEVRDSGAGMTSDVAMRAFEPFFTSKEAGEGIGLSQVYGFAKQSGGHVEIETAPESGTAVKLFFPAIRVGPEGAR